MDFDNINTEFESNSRKIYTRLRDQPHVNDLLVTVEEVVKAHGVPEHIFSIRLKTLLHVARLMQGMQIPYHGLSDLKGLRILDIACGKVENKDPNFHPWFCRVAHHLGCRITGVDFGTTHTEHWEYRNLDLSDPDVLRCFGDCSFDVTHSTYFIGNKDAERDNDPAFSAAFGQDSMAYIVAQKKILLHMNRIARPNGVVIINDSAGPKR